MWTIDSKSGPVYLQLADQVVVKLAKGELKPGERLPSTRDLAKEALVNPNTVVSAYAELETRNIIEKRRGLGSFIRSEVELSQLKLELLTQYSQEFLQKVEAIGLSVSEAVEHIQTMRKP